MPTANAGTGGNECDLNFQLNAISSAGTGTWTMTSGPGEASFSPNANRPNAIVTVSVYGTYTFRWTEVNGICSGNNSITVNFYQQPVANAGTGGNNCGFQFHLNGSMNVGTGVWTKVSGTGTVLFSPSDTSPNATVTVLGYGAYSFRWNVTNGTCTSSSTVNVTFVQQPAADAGDGGEECDDNFILDAVPGTGGFWSTIAGPGSAVFSDSAQPDATVTVDEPGTYEFEWTISNSSCESTDFITVIFRNLPDVSAGRDTIICEDGSAQLQATGEGSFIWEPSASLSASGIANPVASPNVTTTYTVTLTDEFGCQNSDEVEVEVSDIPVAFAGPDRVLHYVFNTSMDAMTPESGTGIWSIISGSGNISNLNDESADITGLALGDNIFQWTVDNGVCPAVIDIVILTVQDIIIPTLITPDHGDDYNEYFVIKGLETLGKTSLVIFDRRGLKVYENNNYNNDWNGVDRNNMDLPEDTYFYVLKSQNRKSLSGYVLIRR
jgi:gliding motility-associated-like protein